ncbi:MAG: DNA-processing protein DprA [Candidatus Pristimantibacillus lignocellulolyticus]|uniref:DNA-processing protein DprA n=1 Tax=Candidatus Pristimantibacillus lignocellulolyticus TaxID=2994561 RepID=A0A9J6ZBK6_9BACL|nr:MAG: DNA-processing protein DprA [Candidatus Pristimantibacillus lignocellulolyticus]
MNNNQYKHFIIELSEVQGVGWHTMKLIIDSNLYEEDVWHVERLQQLGVKAQISERLHQFRSNYTYERNEERVTHQLRNRYTCITYWDEQYPETLKQIAQPPWILYVRGRLELLQRQSLAIVGTRYPTSYGKQCTKLFSGQFAQQGLTIVSGFANGVDTIAHKEALSYGSSTIAILPTAITQCYPANNYEMYERIGEEGLLLSESVHASPIHPGQFHQRNRIIAGLSFASIIIEGERKSGSMITAKHAIDMDRELFAVPGPINSAKSEGPNFLIQNGYARMLLSSHQLFEELPWLKPIANSQNKNETKHQMKNKLLHELSEDEVIIVTLLREKSLSINEIFNITNIPFGHLNVLLLNLCIKQFIEQHPGSIYIAL